MKTLRHIAGILLAAVGVLFSVSAVVVAFEPHEQFPLLEIGVMFFALGLFPLSAAYVLLLPTLTAPGRPCPQCGGTERQPAGVLRTSRSSLLFHLCGWLFATLWGASREQQVRCVQCDKLYMTDTRATRIGGVLLWVFILIVAASVIEQSLEGR